MKNTSEEKAIREINLIKRDVSPVQTSLSLDVMNSTDEKESALINFTVTGISKYTLSKLIIVACKSKIKSIRLTFLTVMLWRFTIGPLPFELIFVEKRLLVILILEKDERYMEILIMSDSLRMHWKKIISLNLIETKTRLLNDPLSSLPKREPVYLRSEVKF